MRFKSSNPLCRSITPSKIKQNITKEHLTQLGFSPLFLFPLFKVRCNFPQHDHRGWKTCKKVFSAVAAVGAAGDRSGTAVNRTQSVPGSISYHEPHTTHTGLEGQAYWRCAAASCWAAWNRSTKPVELCKSARCSRWELNSVKTAIILFAIFVYILLTQFCDTFCLKNILLWWWMFKQLFFNMHIFSMLGLFYHISVTIVANI